MADIVPLVLCGGAGTRLWPASRAARPKQFLPLLDGRSLFQDTLRRVMADGFVYEGGWDDGEIDGEGVATYANGDIYGGTFVNGKRQGNGTIRYATGQEAAGVWEDGALVERTDQDN